MWESEHQRAIRLLLVTHIAGKLKTISKKAGRRLMGELHDGLMKPPLVRKLPPPQRNLPPNKGQIAAFCSSWRRKPLTHFSQKRSIRLSREKSRNEVFLLIIIFTNDTMEHSGQRGGQGFSSFQGHVWCTHTFAAITGGKHVKRWATTHAEHKAFLRPFVPLLNLTIVSPRQGTDKVWMDLLRALKVEPMPCISAVNAVRMSKACRARP